ncbi:cytochrome [Oceanicola sp. D3]|uniref:cytochrome b/b6 domain-containing protein n=1 Tax=Oceanicola sp. D3 TaxID=2587163 RepID=UPI001121D25F|nr:cytochrome b/b6 domain-containing protein [Oceanicola sp. D3]QDC09764.1 cytochrome [Oceanicola sp. D3]
MSLANTQTRYGTVAKSFHWLTVLLILTLWPLGWFANWWPYDTQAAFDTKWLLFSLHKTFGVILFAVAILRVIWALTQTHPRLLNGENRVESLAAEVVHWVLYGSIIALPVTGWIEHAASTGYAPILWPFGQGLPFIPKDVDLAVAFAHMHVALTWVILGAVGLHVAGALKHALIDRDGIMSRMWFTKKAPPTPPATKGHGPAPAVIATGALAIALAFPFIAGEEAAATTETSAEAAESAEAPAQTARTTEPTGEAPVWTVESGTIGLTIQQMGQAVSGTFPEFTAAISYNPEATGPTKGEASLEINIATLVLGSVAAQAQGPDYFDSAEHPTATYSGPIIAGEDGNLRLDGTLSIKGHSAEVPLPFTLTIDGNTATASGTTTVDRRTFHIGDSMTDEGSLAFPVEISIEITATR